MTIIRKIENGEEIKVGVIYTLNKDGIKGPKGYIADVAFISKITQDTETMIQKYELTYLFENTYQTILIEPDDINLNRISGLSKYGVTFDPFFAKDFSRYLIFQKKMLKATKVVSQAGWVVNEMGLSYVTADSLDLSYGGDLAIKKNGSFDDWITGVKKLVVGNVELELILAIALSTVFIGYDSLVLHKDIGSSTINLFGDSSSGKSTSAILAISCFGETNSQKNGSLIKSFSSTKNAMVKSLAGLNSVMLCYDDLSSTSTSDVSDLIYNVGNGKEKDRLNERSQMQEGASFTTQVLVTGEESLQQYTKMQGGIGVRYTEFESLQYSRSAQHSEQLKKIFQNNYVFAAPMFAEYLLTLEDTELSDAFDDIVNSFKEEFPDCNGKIQRFIKRISSIFLSAQLIEQCFDINFNQEEIYELLLKTIEKQALLLDYTATTLRMVTSWITRKQNHFAINGNTPQNAGDIFGEINTVDGYVQIPKDIFEMIIQELSLPSSNSILREWKREGLIKTEKDRLYYRDGNKENYMWLKQTINVFKEEK